MLEETLYAAQKHDALCFCCFVWFHQNREHTLWTDFFFSVHACVCVVCAHEGQKMVSDLWASHQM